MRTAVVTDTAAYLTPEQIEKFHITVLPVTVILGGKEYKETEELGLDTFYDYLKNEEELPTTAQVSMGQIEEAYDRLVSEGYDNIISIHLSSGITSFMDNLRMFCKSYDKATVYPFDSLCASAGEADLAMLAGAMILEGKTPEEIVPQMEKMRSTRDVYFAVDDLKHLMRTGRLSNRSAVIGNLLNIKPLLTFDKEGKIIAIDKARTMKRALKAIFVELRKYSDSVDFKIHATVIDANNESMSENWANEIHEAFPEIRVSRSQLGPAISVHTGEKTMGILWEQDWQELSK
ncbi:DegV family protein [Companilactobacillus ginsenosidimutans]|uniref:DegV family EDD domain-containing protein n=1 Tax=Companilactobacillus ginsenosidimutans TaxID=1007676 RepID=A0A0H4QI77_9LACO|nr:DegV family protein [Companilactobacillus ginsenosidimutans]AKP68134.1 DegV family EDD domain-containing protein [Companilactobacillus ginsenosidimutans]